MMEVLIFSILNAFDRLNRLPHNSACQALQGVLRMDDVCYIHKSKHSLSIQKMNELTIEHESDLRKTKEIFLTVRAERDSALSSLEIEKKENTDLQSSVFRLGSTVAEQDKMISAYQEEIRRLKEARVNEKRGFQSLTADFVQSIKSECRRLVSLHHPECDFTPIQRISLRDLSDVIRKEKSTPIITESHSIALSADVDPATEAATASTFVQGPSVGGSSTPASPKD